MTYSLIMMSLVLSGTFDGILPKEDGAFTNEMELSSEINFNYTLRVIPPPKEIKYHILIKKPDPDIDYKILIIPKKHTTPLRIHPRYRIRKGFKP